jgi:hypothetical protein
MLLSELKLLRSANAGRRGPTKKRPLGTRREGEPRIARRARLRGQRQVLRSRQTRLVSLPRGAKRRPGPAADPVGEDVVIADAQALDRAPAALALAGAALGKRQVAGSARGQEPPARRRCELCPTAPTSWR